MTKLTHAEQAAAYLIKNWGALNRDVPPLVSTAFRRIKYNPQDYDDLRQEGLAAGLAAVRTWNPELGSFSNHVITRIRYAIQEYQRKNFSIVRRALQSDVPLDAEEGDPEDEKGSLLERLTYPEDAPEGFGDPRAEIGRKTAPEAAERLIRQAGSRARLVLRSLYGVGVPKESFQGLSIRTGIPKANLSRLTRKTEKYLERKQKTPDKGYTRRVKVRQGPRPLRFDASQDCLHVSADRYLGFWNGLAGVTTMGGAWRESIGRVYADWAWKPTSDDIKRGCKP